MDYYKLFRESVESDPLSWTCGESWAPREGSINGVPASFRRWTNIFGQTGIEITIGDKSITFEDSTDKKWTRLFRNIEHAHFNEIIPADSFFLIIRRQSSHR